MTVSIDVDLDAIDAKMEIGQLKMMLESLDEDLNIDLDLDGDLGGTLDDLSDTMDELSESFTSDLEEVADRFENLELDNIEVIRGNGDSGGDTGSDSGDELEKFNRKRKFQDLDINPDLDVDLDEDRNTNPDINVKIDEDRNTNPDINVKLDEDRDSDLDVKVDFGNIVDDLSDTMEEISESFTSNLEEVADRFENLELDNINVVQRDSDSDGDSDLDVKVDFGNIVDDLSDTMEEISESFTSNLEEVADRFENLELDNIEVVQRGGDSDSDSGSGGGDYTPSVRKRFNNKPFEKNDNTALTQALNKFHNNIAEQADAFDIAARFDDRDDGGSVLNTGIDRDWDTNIGDFEIDPDISKDGFKEFDRPLSKIYGLNTGIDRDWDTNIDDFELDGEISRDGFEAFDRGPKEVYGRMEAGGWDPSTSSDDTSRKVKRTSRTLSKIKNLTGDLKNRFKRLIPSMSTWLNLVGAAIPALGAMAVQAAGVATAFGAIALAGAGMVGLGLLGDGDTMAESMRNAKEEVADLKQELFETFEPTADLFNGVQTEFFDFIPGELERVARSMEGLIVYKDEFFEMFTQITKFGAQFFDMIVKNHSTISELWDNFKGITGSNIIGFFEFLLQAAKDNQGMLKTLGSVLINFGVALYEVFLIIGRTVAMLSPLFVVLTYLAKLLNNSLVSGMLAIVAVFYMATSALSIFTGAMGMVATVLSTGLIPLFSSLFTYMSTWLFQTLAQTMANYGLAASIANVAAALGTLLAMSGIGLLIGGAGLAIGKASGMLDPVGGNMDDISSSSGNGGGTTNIVNEGDNINVDIGNMETSSVEKFGDMRSGDGNKGPIGGSYTG